MAGAPYELQLSFLDLDDIVAERADKGAHHATQKTAGFDGEVPFMSATFLYPLGMADSTYPVVRAERCMQSRQRHS